MADIRPLRAWRYNLEKAGEIAPLTSPLFDVISEKQRAKLYQNPLSSIHLSVPKGHIPAEEAAKTLQKWKHEGILSQDGVPGIYVYYQYFTLPGSSKEHVRKGFICNIRAYDWNESPYLMRHENTMPHSVNDRISIVERTQLNVSPTHGLYQDPSFALEKFMDEAILDPIVETENYQGVCDVLAVIHDKDIIQKFVDKLSEERIILADGHHRYESSMLYQQRCMANNPNHTGEEGYNFHLMYLSNSSSDDLQVLPTHRLIEGLPGFSEEKIIEALADDFNIKSVENACDINEIILGKKHAFGLVFKDNTYKIRLKPERYQSIPWKFPPVIKELDLTVMHYHLIEKVLGIPGKEQRSSRNINFDRNFASCLEKVKFGDAQLAIIMKGVTIDQVKQVCESGYTMPQKSTYFYPKVICGFLFSSIEENEFALPSNFSF